MKIHKNNRSKKKLYISLDILSSEVICPFPGAILMYKIMKKNLYKSEFKAILMILTAILTANVLSDYSFL